MAWEKCVDNIKQTLDPNAKEIKEVDWADIKKNQMDALRGDTFSQGVPFTLVCPDRHCTDYADFSIQAHRVCNCLDIFGHRIPNCEPKDALFPYKANVCLNVDNPGDYSGKASMVCTDQGKSYFPLSCYCCCSCFAYGTKISVPLGTRKIQDFRIGDQAMAGSLGLGRVPAVGPLEMKWEPALVSFSGGTGPDSHEAVMVYIQHGKSGMIIVTPDHLFLMPDGRFKRGDRLVPGKDFLVGEDGSPVPIHEVSLGEYEGGVHHIALDLEFTGSPDGHLLLSDGVVSGDFNLQIHAADLKEKGYFVGDHDALPKIGSPRYEEENNGHLIRGEYPAVYAALRNDNQPQGLEKNQGRQLRAQRRFYLHGERVSPLPQMRAAYLSREQATALMDLGDMRDFADLGKGNSTVNYLLKLFGGFYRNIVFYYDTGRLEPNAYAFRQNGRDTIVLTGGLMRVKGLAIHGLSLILSHLIVRLQASQPVDDLGFTSAAMADYYSIQPMQTVDFGDQNITAFQKGMEELKAAVFQIIAQRADKYVGDPYEPDTKTRLAALKTGFDMVYPPAGIGGPQMEALALLKGEARPPILSPAGFETPEIDEDRAGRIWNKLKEHGVLTGEGSLLMQVGCQTDLSFLFAEEDLLPACERFFTEQVRSILMRAPATIQLVFNMPVSQQSGSVAVSYVLTPESKVLSAEVQEEKVTLYACIQRETLYKVRVARYVMAADGSTLDTQAAEAEFQL